MIKINWEICHIDVNNWETVAIDRSSWRSLVDHGVQRFQNSKREDTSQKTETTNDNEGQT